MPLPLRLLAPIAALLALTGAAPDPMSQVTSHIRAVRTLTADFAQTDRRGQTLTGVLTLKQPGKIRFQYRKGVPMLVVGDGKALVVIDYAVRQVQRWPIGNSPLGALVNPSIDLSRFGTLVQGGDASQILIEARDPKRPEFGALTLVFARRAGAPAGLELQGWVARDAQNNRTSVRLSNQRYGAPVADSIFRWTDPRPAASRGGGR